MKASSHLLFTIYLLVLLNSPLGASSFVPQTPPLSFRRPSFADVSAAAAPLKPQPLSSPSPAAARRRLPSSAAEALDLASAPVLVSYRIWYELVPTPVRFFLSGSIGNYLFYCIDERLCPALISLKSPSSSVPSSRIQTASFFLSYLLSIPLCHFLNALLVYTLPTLLPLKQKYLKSLSKAYAVYAFAVVLTTALNAALQAEPFFGGLSKSQAFVASVYGVGVINFFVMGKLMKEKRVKE